MSRHDGLIEKNGFAVSDGEKMAVYYDDIVGLRPTFPHFKM